MSWHCIWIYNSLALFLMVHLSHWGRLAHICVSKLTTIGSDNSLLPGQHQATIRTMLGYCYFEQTSATSSAYSINFHSEKCIVCEMGVILSGLQCVKHNPGSFTNVNGDQRFKIMKWSVCKFWIILMLCKYITYCDLCHGIPCISKLRNQ